MSSEHPSLGHLLYRDEEYNVFVRSSNVDAYHVGINLLMEELGLGMYDERCGASELTAEERSACLYYTKALLKMEGEEREKELGKPVL